MSSTKHLNYSKMIETKGKQRQRGRPRGKPRPLTQEERRNRNAELERDRRDHMAESFSLLRAELGQDSKVTRADTLAAACDFISRDRCPSLDALRRQNECLQRQIEILQGRLGDSTETEEEDPQQEQMTAESVMVYLGSSKTQQDTRGNREYSVELRGEYSGHDLLAALNAGRVQACAGHDPPPALLYTPMT